MIKTSSPHSPGSVKPGGPRYYLSAQSAALILAAIDKKKPDVLVSADLNLSSKTFLLDNDTVCFDEINHLGAEQLRKILKKPNRVFLLTDGIVSIVEYFEGAYYKLVPTSGPPTAEIDGVKMHRSKDVDPYTDAMQKAREVVRPNDYVLDTCSGLGYTAIWAMRLGARGVLSVEYSPTMLKLRRDNPWSREVDSPDIEVVEGDAGVIIENLDSASFDSVLHDPPRLSLAGHLYGERFYSQLYRVLKPGGGLFHYTGNPHQARHGNSFLLNAAKRLKAAGFNKVTPREEILGVTAFK